MKSKAPHLAPFAHPVFRNIWVASLASNIGGLIQNVGAAWLMTSIGGTRGEIALVQASQTLPIVLFSLAAGAIADNFDRRRLMLSAQLFLLFVSIGLTVVTYFKLMSPWLLLGFTFLVGCGNAFNGPAWQSLIGEMVPRRDLPAAISLNAMGFNLARSVGPALGGFIVGTVGAFAAFAVNSMSYAGLITVLVRWRITMPQRVLPPERLGTAMVAGVRYVAMSPGIRVVLGRGAVFGVGAVVVQALLPIVARDLVGGGALTYGLLLGSFGAGAVAGAFLSSRLREALSLEALIRCAFCAMGACASVTALSSSPALTMAAMVSGGASWMLAMSSFNASVQLSAPRWVVGRVLALYQMATFGGMSVGSWFWGMIAEEWGTRTALAGASLVLLVGAALGLRYVMPDIKSMEEQVPADWTAPEAPSAIQRSTSPILVTIEYLIRDEDLAEFLAAMQERRRIRIRNGARHWSLLRDLANSHLWTERYDTPSWADYVRQNRRMTQADAELGKKLRALHQGPEPPRVRRMVEDRTGWSAAGGGPTTDDDPPLSGGTVPH